MAEKMTLEQVRDELRKLAFNPPKNVFKQMFNLADSIDAHLAQPAQAVDVGAIREVVFWLTSNSQWITGAYKQGQKLTRAIGNAREDGE